MSLSWRFSDPQRKGNDMDEATDKRREMLATGQPRKDEEADTGPKWTTQEMQEEFEVIGFAAPFVVVRRRSDGQKGTLEFTHMPRVYFGWTEHRP
jgi:hypothetical protein